MGDKIIGDGDDNYLLGGIGDDTLNGGGGADTLAGGAGNDLYFVDNPGDVVVENADEGRDTVRSTVDWALGANLENLVLLGSAVIGSGNELDNRITGNKGDNDLTGGDGNDTLVGGVGADMHAGGKGDDVYIVDNEGDMIVEELDEGHDTIRSSTDWFLSNNIYIEDLVLTGGASISGIGNELANNITGNSGDNNLLGAGGDDSLSGGQGIDYLDGGAGNDTMRGGVGDDAYVVQDAGDKVIEGASGGTDDIVLAWIDYTLAANVERMYIYGGSHFVGNKGDNIIWNAAGHTVTIDGGAGDDVIQSSSATSTLIGGAGNDHFIFSFNNGLVVEKSGGGEDTIEAWQDIDLANYTNVENLMVFGAGRPHAVTTGTGDALANRISGDGAANVLYGLDGNDVIDGDYFNGGGAVANDTLYGGNGDDWIEGSVGSDLLDGGDGADTLTGGWGNDLYVVGDFDTVIEEADQGHDTVRSSVDWWLSDNPAVEDLELTGEASGGFGNALANTITGNSVDNLLFGDGGDDSLSAAEGNDYLDGSTGNDTMLGGVGDDAYVVDTAGDVVIEAADGGAADLVLAWVDYTLGANVENMRVLGGTHFVGNSGDNSITNTTDHTLTIDGGDGNDLLLSGTGKATLIGGAGDDRYIFNTLEDAVVETAGGGDDTIEIWYSGNIDLGSFANVENLVIGAPATGSGTTATGDALANKIAGNGAANILYGLDGNDTLDGDHFNSGGGVGNDTLYGGNGDDWIEGSVGSDLLDGGDGNDTLVAGGGADQLTGGAGSDTFDITVRHGLDSVTDFQSGANGDILDISDLLTGYDGVTSDANDFVRFSASAGGTLVQVDADGVGGSIGFLDTVQLKGVSLTDVGQAIADGNLVMQH